MTRLGVVFASGVSIASIALLTLAPDPEPGVIPVVPLDVQIERATTTDSTTTTTTVPPVPITTSVEVVRVPEVESPRWLAAPDWARCPEWWLSAQVVGWEPELLPVLDLVMWRESRCLPEVIGNGGYGLLQIQWSVHSDWIEGLGFSRDDMLRPSANLAAGRVLWQMAEDSSSFQCGWSPWYMSQPGRHWCEVDL
jgi:hypothetical protein